VTETLEPAFGTEAEAMAHYAPLLDGGFASLVCGFDRLTKPKALKPSMLDGMRWPKAPKSPKPQWKLKVSYWKIISKSKTDQAPKGSSLQIQARAARKAALDIELTPEEVKALAQAPLMAYRPQKALDIGLFEARLPENSAIIIADE
jgi:hypothetical protein